LLRAKPDALTRRLDVYPKKSFEDKRNAFNQRIIIPPEHLQSVVLLNKEGLLNRIRNSPPDAYFKANEPRDTADNPSQRPSPKSPTDLTPIPAEVSP
ncbi:hypothetical protein C0992_010732, partial [Termitomyces sp. T32_za158]